MTFVSNGQVVRNATGRLMQAITLITVIPPGGEKDIGSKIGHELQHGNEFGSYGDASKAPDARPSVGGKGIETQTALDIETAIQSELSQGTDLELTAEEEGHLFDVPANCTSNPSKCPNPEPTTDPGTAADARPPQ